MGLEIKPVHTLTFQNVDDSVAIPVVESPFYVYKVGDIITVKESYSDEEGTKSGLAGEYEVMDIEHQIVFSLVCEQDVIVHIKKLEEK